MDAILVCVDYSDILAMTLPYNRHHFERVTVITSLSDHKTIHLASNLACSVHITNAFYEDGAAFNKWKALEEGLTVSGRGRGGWLCIMDADIIWPKAILGSSVNPKNAPLWLTLGNLYTPRRHMLKTIPESVPDESLWANYPIHPQEREFAGYTQIFHSNDPHLGNPPWHQTNWKHAGGADSFFQAKWDNAHKVRPPFNVLHLGPSGQNWCGRVTPYTDGTLPARGQQRTAQLRNMLSQRGTDARDRFAAEKIP